MCWFPEYFSKVHPFAFFRFGKKAKLKLLSAMKFLKNTDELFKTSVLNFRTLIFQIFLK